MSSVALVIFMVVIMPCSVGYDSLLIWWIVMLYPHDYVDIMFIHFIMAHHICIQVNQIKLNLNNCWLSHGAAETMLTSATMLAFM